MSYTLSDFDYKLPSELIAQKPLHPRDQSRLLVLNKKDGAISHRHFYNLPEFLKPGDVLVINNSKVFPARLIGTKDLTGGRVEIFLHRKIKGNIWECLVGGKVKVGSKINFFDKLGKAKEKNQNEASAKSIGSIGTKNQAQLQATLIKNNSVKLQATLIKNNQDGTWQVKFNLSGLKFNQVVQEIGEVPLPPYIKRIKPLASDRNTYQTIYAAEKKLGSVAAPTAGLHFTKDLLKKIKASGVEVLEVTLNVGLGTFAPVKTEKIKDHRMHSESVQIKKEVLKKIIRAKQDGRRIIAVGTTTCRTLESWGQSLKQKKVNQANKAEKNLDPKLVKADFKTATSIFIYPPYKFQVIDALITNFHLPKSSLLMLVAALAGKNKIDKAYETAIKQKYRFFSYGDAMIIS